ncbi:hypothetical protein [Roseobacter sinensis]|uniref:Uncharacterized protein n=1 Tax=Roseobacter sinensis TaxID=2931391 RepID=A0ABT3BJ76_9RHOB|nr:hypothetical protein [Roseobacter sp. WL0113]MCV3273625.1 hypothetical protein [Roseobacter sp. WL0113]
MILPLPVVTGPLDDWPKAKGEGALATGSLIQPYEVTDCVGVMLTRLQDLTIRDVVLLSDALDL